ncbi:MAG: riboflavin synthase [Hydrogenophilaceae bacterium]|jgi:riboflavin synthase|nr:riboflavin synthase [Hydrogenophilaceae bacterium]
MFTGIVTAVGEVTRAERAGEQARFEIASSYDPDTVAIGASISHAGCCLTVVSREKTNAGMRHIVECSPETLALTTLGQWRVGARMNLERAARVGDELGGHIVAGHVDGMGELASRGVEGDYLRLTFAAPRALMPYLAPKGSIAIDGVSLTVNAVERETFSVMIIPHTASETTLGVLTPGDRVNLEADLIARYVARMLAFRAE